MADYIASVNLITKVLDFVKFGGSGDPKERTLDLIITEELRALTCLVEWLTIC